MYSINDYFDKQKAMRAAEERFHKALADGLGIHSIDVDPVDLRGRKWGKAGRNGLYVEGWESGWDGRVCRFETTSPMGPDTVGMLEHDGVQGNLYILTESLRDDEFAAGLAAQH